MTTISSLIKGENNLKSVYKLKFLGYNRSKSNKLKKVKVMKEVKNVKAERYIMCLVDAKLLAVTSVIPKAERAATEDIKRVQVNFNAYCRELDAEDYAIMEEYIFMVRRFFSAVRNETRDISVVTIADLDARYGA